MNKIKLFLENKSHGNPRAMYAGLMYACAYMSLCMQLGFQKLWKVSFSTLKLRFGMNPTSSGCHSKSPFFNYIKPYMVYFKETEKRIWSKNIRFTRNSEPKRVFFTKHPQSQYFLIKAFFGLDLWVLKSTTHFCLVVN